MSTSASKRWNSATFEIEAVVDEFLALVEEQEARLSRGQVPPAFLMRLAELRQTTELLIDS